MAGQVLLPVKVPSFTGLNGTTSGASSRAAGDGAGSSVAVMATPAGDADGLEQAGDLVRVITTPHHPRLLWVHEHLQHLSSHVRVIADPASHVAEQRRLPWWRLASHSGVAHRGKGELARTARARAARTRPVRRK